jgi:hypothetical protein
LTRCFNSCGTFIRRRGTSNTLDSLLALRFVPRGVRHQAHRSDLSPLDFACSKGTARCASARDQLTYPPYQKPELMATAPNRLWSLERTCPVRSIERMPPCLLSSVTTMALRRTSCDSGRLGPGRTFNSWTETAKSLLTFTSLRWCRTSRERLNCVSCR